MALASEKLGSVFVTILPIITFFAGLFADWIKQRMTHGFEEKKQLARVISDLLELHYSMLVLRELKTIPRKIISTLPQVIQDQIPEEALNALDLAKLLPVDEKLGERYRKAVDEIAAYRPVVAFRLRGKERYFDFRNFVSGH